MGEADDLNRRLFFFRALVLRHQSRFDIEAGLEYLFSESNTVFTTLRRNRVSGPIRLSICFFFVINLGICVVKAQDAGFRGNTAVIQSVIDRASFEFYNESMYRDQNKWIGKTIAFQGIFARHPVILNTDKPYEECEGSNPNKDPIDVIVFFDTPLLVEPKDVMSAQSVTKTEVFRVFGIVQKCREVITRTGNVRVLPVLDLLLVYRADDQTFRYPIWVSKGLQK